MHVYGQLRRPTGAGAAVVSAEPNLIGCRFENNVIASAGKGCGLYNQDSNSLIQTCTFKKNTGGSRGGAFYSLHCDPNVVGCTFTENAASVSGGAAGTWGGGRPRFTSCQFVANTANQEGGAADNRECSPRYVSCVFIRNRSLSEGGAVYCQTADANFVNCVLNGNKADYRGGGISFYESDAQMVNCTFSANTALTGQAFTCDSSLPPDTRGRLVVASGILWDSGSEIENRDGSDISVTYTTVYGNWSGIGNRQTNPMFEDRDGADNVVGNEDDKLGLSKGSLCIDAGKNQAVPSDIKRDVTGKKRFIDDPATTDSGVGTPPIVDMGAYEYGTDSQNQNPPVANAGPDQSVHAAANGYASVTLDGSASYDPDGSALLYSWTWTIGSQTYSTTGVKPAIQLPVGQHYVNLVVFDGTLYSDPDTVRITVLAGGGSAPVANAGQDRTVYATGGTASVMLDGSGSYDPEGSSLQYNWTWTIGSQTYNTTGVKPTVQLPVGQRSIQLIVFDGTTYSSPDTVVITVVQSGGSAPVADAGQDKTVTAGTSGYASVMLDGSGSYDPEGSSLQYNWTWTIGSQTYSTTGVNPTIQLPVGQRTVQLTVYDGTNTSDPDTVVITVLQSSGSAPVAHAGQDRTVTAGTSGYASVMLDGSGSYDPEGSSLQYNWTWTIGSQTYSTTGVNPTIQLPVGQRTVQLTVYDGTNTSDPDTVVITVLQSSGSAPVADAGQDRTVTAGTSGYASVMLDGSGSYDPEGSSLQYNWTWTIGSQTYSTTGVKPTIQLPVGQRSIQLIVSDGTNTSDPDTVVITVLQSSGSAPVANAGQDRTVYAGNNGYASVVLDGSGSYDPEGSSLQYNWTWNIGSQSYSATGVKPTVLLPVGQRSIQLTVYDGTLYSNPDTVVITVLQNGGDAPVANAGQDRSVYAASSGAASVMLDGSSSYDPEGSSLQYTWTWTVGSQSYSATGIRPTVQLPVGQRAIQLVVFDGINYSDPDTVVITVLQSGGAVPIAHAGQDRTVNAAANGYATVTLDGSDSYDPEGSSLQYTWTWTIGWLTYSTTGVRPTIQLPVGQRTIELIVSDGTNTSDPDTVVITVLQNGGDAPVANAGPDRTAYAPAGGYASVALDGSASYDPEGSSLQYTWTWTVGDQAFEATGAAPTIALPVGQYEIGLVVFDGVNYSAADSLQVNVVQPLVYPLYLSPYHVSLEDSSRYVIVLMVLPEIGAADVDLTVPITLSPGNVPAFSQHASEQTTGGLRTTVVGMFYEEDVLNAIPDDGPISVTVTGQLTSGQSFQGTASLWLIH